MLVTNKKDVEKFTLWTKNELKTQGYDYDNIRKEYDDIQITESDVKYFIETKIDTISSKENTRKKQQTLKYFKPESIRTSYSTDTSFIDFLRQKGSTYLSNGNLQLNMTMDLYKLKNIVFEWEQSCQKNQYRWWSNPVTNLIAYQIYRITGLFPFSLQKRNEQMSRPPKKNVSNESSDKEKNDYGVIYSLTHKITKKQYVGQTKRIVTKRFKEHKRVTSGCHLLRNAIQKDGFAAFEKRLLAICKISDLDRLEAFFINKHNCVYPNGYNANAGNLTFIPTNTEETSLISYKEVDEMEIDMLITESCKAIRDADDVQSKHDLIELIKQYHPDKTDDQEKNDECKKLLEKLRKDVV